METSQFWRETSQVGNTAAALRLFGLENELPNHKDETKRTRNETRKRKNFSLILKISLAASCCRSRPERITNNDDDILQLGFLVFVVFFLTTSRIGNVVNDLLDIMIKTNASPEWEALGPLPVFVCVCVLVCVWECVGVGVSVLTSAPSSARIGRQDAAAAKDALQFCVHLLLLLLVAPFAAPTPAPPPAAAAATTNRTQINLVIFFVLVLQIKLQK